MGRGRACRNGIRSMELPPCAARLRSKTQNGIVWRYTSLYQAVSLAGLPQAGSVKPWGII